MESPVCLIIDAIIKYTLWDERITPLIIFLFITFFSVEFVAYFFNRDSRVKKMKEQLSDYQKEKERLTAEQRINEEKYKSVRIYFFIVLYVTKDIIVRRDTRFFFFRNAKLLNNKINDIQLVEISNVYRWGCFKRKRN